MAEPLLSGRGRLHAAYGDARALHGVSLTLAKGETLALIGANGAGKSTLLKSICGLVSAERRPHICFKGEDITRLPANAIVKLGVALVPEGRRLFPSLSVEENLILGAKVRRQGPWTLESVYALVSDPEGAPPPAGDFDVGGPAADVRDRPRADVEPRTAAARRTEPRPRAGRHQGHLRAAAARRSAAASARSSSNRTSRARWPRRRGFCVCRKAACRSRATRRPIRASDITRAYFGT